MEHKLGFSNLAGFIGFANIESEGALRRQSGFYTPEVTFGWTIDRQTNQLTFPQARFCVMPDKTIYASWRGLPQGCMLAILTKSALQPTNTNIQNPAATATATSTTHIRAEPTDVNPPPTTRTTTTTTRPCFISLATSVPQARCADTPTHIGIYGNQTENTCYQWLCDQRLTGHYTISVIQPGVKGADECLRQCSRAGAAAACLGAQWQPSGETQGALGNCLLYDSLTGGGGESQRTPGFDFLRKAPCNDVRAWVGCGAPWAPVGAAPIPKPGGAA
jgi:hypothetical protein